MKSYDDWLGEHDVSKDALGGLVPDKKARARKVDLITLPKAVTGTNCFNCKWVMHKKGDIRFCEHPEVHEKVTARMCCAKWDHPGVKRHF